ncbi:hypothetical protein [Brucella pituitosa]|uniref:hypothetical protein n=1 Tax=Brucella pituitosa TaxID=571256 RepID=UPI000FE22768|nr:hypothetical protein [Brucella pituitosa]
MNDAVAIGPKGNIVVEVVAKGSPTAQAKEDCGKFWRITPTGGIVYGGKLRFQCNAIETVEALNK